MDNSKNKPNKKDINDFRNWLDFQEEPLDKKQISANQNIDEVKDASELVYGWKIEELEEKSIIAMRQIDNGKFHTFENFDDLLSLVKSRKNEKP